MSRLTDKVRNFDGTASAKESLIDEKYHHPSDYCSKILTKLADYEDKQEQGLLIELPCKVGDTVFLLMNGNTRIVECTVLWIELHRNGTVVFSLDGGTGDVVIAHLGKKWFLTRSEAEEALAKIGGKE